MRFNLSAVLRLCLYLGFFRVRLVPRQSNFRRENIRTGCFVVASKGAVKVIAEPRKIVSCIQNPRVTPCEAQRSIGAHLRTPKVTDWLLFSASTPPEST